MAEPSIPGLTFEEAREFFDAKARVGTRTWRDLWEDQHARAFTVAGAMQDELLSDFQQAVRRAITDGRTLADFREDFDRIVAARGWSHRGSRGWRSRVIFETNLRTAYQAGRWKQIQRVKDRRPFLRYSAVLDGSTRPEHREWHGTTLPVDHPWWNTHYPPNGWGCRCTAIQVSARQAEREGLVVSDDPPPGGMERKSLRGGGSVEVPEGIDPGWAYNVGDAAWSRQLSEQAMRAWSDEGPSAWRAITSGDAASAGRPQDVPLDSPAAAPGATVSGRTARRRALERALGGEERIVQTPDGGRVAINARALAGRIDDASADLIPLVPEMLGQPFEVWQAFERHAETGKIVLRRRLVKAIEASPGRSVGTVAIVRGGLLEALDFVSPDALAGARRGALAFARTQQPSD